MFKLVVLCSVVAFASAIGPLGIGPLGLGHLGLGGWPAAGHLGWPAAGHLGWPAAAGLVGPLAPLGVPGALAVGAPGVHGVPNYRGPLSLPPGQPANIVAADGRPLDTLSVNLDRSAHWTARALDGARAHHLLKRSAPLIAAPLAVSHTSRIDLPGHLIAPAHLGVAPLGLHGIGPVGPIAPWGLGHGALGHGALGHLGVGPWGLGHGLW